LQQVLPFVFGLVLFAVLIGYDLLAFRFIANASAGRKAGHCRFEQSRNGPAGLDIVLMY
jgi:hypothetical protein